MLSNSNKLILKAIFFACFSVFLFFSSTIFAADKNIAKNAEKNNAQATSQLTTILDKTHAMQADFEQFATSKSKKQHEQSHGQMALSRPGKFRWETKAPSQQLIIANDNLVWMYDKDLEQVTKNKVDYKQPGNPAMLLSGTSDTLKNTFNVTKLNMPGVGVWFELQPKSSNNLYQWIKLHFVDDKLIAMYMADNLGQKSEFQFQNIQINPNLDDSLFKFTPPKGVDIVEGT